MKGKKLELEPSNFSIKYDISWVRMKHAGIEFLLNPLRDICQIISGEFNGQQFFMQEAAIRETKKAGKLMPTDEEYQEINLDIPNLIFAGYYYGGSFICQNQNAFFWSSTDYGFVAGGLQFYSSSDKVDHSTYDKVAGFSDKVDHSTYDKVAGFSVRCLKN